VSELLSGFEFNIKLLFSNCYKATHCLSVENYVAFLRKFQEQASPKARAITFVKLEEALEMAGVSSSRLGRKSGDENARLVRFDPGLQLQTIDLRQQLTHHMY
jgi:hypothetical protein